MLYEVITGNYTRPIEGEKSNNRNTLRSNAGIAVKARGIPRFDRFRLIAILQV